MGGGGCFHGDGYFPRGHVRVFADVDGEVGVEGLQLSGEELVGEGVEAVGAPVKPGPFQKVEPGKRKREPEVCEHLHSSGPVADQMVSGHRKFAFLS